MKIDAEDEANRPVWGRMRETTREFLEDNSEGRKWY